MTEAAAASLSNLYVHEYPEGWYALEPSKALKPGAIRDIDFPGRPMVLFRTHSGSVALLDRHCPHMGASLACGKVEGEHVVCPFHLWRFGASGQCESIPYEPQIPKNAKVGTIPVVEHLGMIWMYHGAQPAFALPEVPEHGAKGWLTQFKSEVLDCHQLVILENPCDLQHLGPVHKLKFKDGFVDITRNEEHDFEIALNLPVQAAGKVQKIKLVVHYSGPTVLFFTLYNGEKVLSKWYIATCPLSQDKPRTRVHMVSIAKRLPWWLLPFQPVVSFLMMRQLYQGMTADYEPVWKRQNTNWRRVLTKADATPQRYRKFYASHLRRAKSTEMLMLAQSDEPGLTDFVDVSGTSLHGAEGAAIAGAHPRR
jgi:nitrite reductase/ring-hydroxylating ferredoxin subunit